MVKYSVVIPTCGNCIKECLETIFKYTTLDEVEILVVANGADDTTCQYINSCADNNVRMIWFNEKIGYTKATNEGIRQAKGKYIVLLNDDTELLPQDNNTWLTQLEEPFNKDENMGLTGIHVLTSPDTYMEFFVFFCVMISQNTVNKVGLLDEEFNPGYGEDIDYYARVLENGLNVECVDEMKFDPEKSVWIGDYPIWHKAEETVHGLSDWEEIKERNIKYLRNKYPDNRKYSIIIPTYNHLDDLLKPCINSLIEYTNLDNGDIEVIIVANGCTDDTAEYVKSLGEPFKLIEEEKPLGAVKPFNLGIKESNGQYIVILNNDIILLPQHKDEWLNRLFIPYMNDSMVGVTGCAPRTWEYGNYVIFFNAMIPKKIFNKVGLFDEEYDVSDIDFCYRVEQQGYKIVGIAAPGEIDSLGGSTSDYPINHLGGATRSENYVYEYGQDRTAIAFKEKYGININDREVENLVIWENPQDREKYFQDFLKYVGKTQDKVIAEVGCFRGYLTRVLLKHFKNVIAVDPWQSGYDEGDQSSFADMDEVKSEFDREAGIADNVEVMEMTSAEASKLIKDESLDIVYIDANHTYDSVIEDLTLWLPKVKLGGYITGHDLWFDVVRQAIGDFFRKEPDISFVDSSFIYKKTKDMIPKKATQKIQIKSKSRSVTACVPTKNRYFTTLPTTLQCIALQSVAPDRLMIFDDGDHKDLREESIYRNLFCLLQSRGIQWEIVFAERKGQVRSHQLCLENTDTEFIWRLDDDDSPPQNVLENLLSTMEDDVAAVGGLVMDPKRDFDYTPKLASSKIEDIYMGMNSQWFKHADISIKEVDHLYNTFLYRRQAALDVGGYPSNLSIIGHREETIFTYKMKRAGWRLLVNPNVVTWHMEDSKGGIRSEKSEKNALDDEAIFTNHMKEWNVVPSKIKPIVLDNGIGDHWAFKHILEEIKEKFHDHKIVIACCYNDVFHDEEDVELISIREARQWLGNNVENFNIYRWCGERNWNKSLVEGFRGMYLGE